MAERISAGNTIGTAAAGIVTVEQAAAVGGIWCATASLHITAGIAIMVTCGTVPNIRGAKLIPGIT